MKVLLVNGSPNKNGCTNRALEEIARVLEKEKIESDIFWIKNKPIGGCIACNRCAELGKCTFDDVVNEFSEKAKDYDGYIFGSPVYYASANGSVNSFLDRVFYSNAVGNTNVFRLKPAAAIASARRAGTITTIDRINKYFQIMEMPIVSSCYWNEVHGITVDDVEKDKEGLQVMRTLGRNMAWLLKLMAIGDAAGVPKPEQEEQSFTTNFIE